MGCVGANVETVVGSIVLRCLAAGGEIAPLYGTCCCASRRRVDLHGDLAPCIQTQMGERVATSAATNVASNSTKNNAASTARVVLISSSIRCMKKRMTSPALSAAMASATGSSAAPRCTSEISHEAAVSTSNP